MNVDALTLRFIKDHPKDAARTLETMEAAGLAAFLAELPAREASGVINGLMPQTAARCLALMAPDGGAAIVALLDVDSAAILLRRLDRPSQSALLSALPAARSAALRLVMRFPDAVVGSAMDAGVPAVSEDMRVREAVAAIQANGSRSIDQLFVIDRNGQLTGIVDFRDLLVADGDAPIRDLARKPAHAFTARESLSSIHDHRAWQAARSVPVVDRNGILLGAISRERVGQALDISAGDSGRQGEVADFVFSFVETLWATFAELFVRGEDRNAGRNKVKS